MPLRFRYEYACAARPATGVGYRRGGYPAWKEELLQMENRAGVGLAPQYASGLSCAITGRGVADPRLMRLVHTGTRLRRPLSAGATECRLSPRPAQ